MGIERARARKFVFLYPDVAAPTIQEIDAGRAPKERLTGFYQLLGRGWNVRISDARWQGRFVSTRRRLKRFFLLPSLGMVRDLLSADAIVVKDDFSLGLTLFAKLTGKKIVYLDSMFSFPRSRLRNWLIKLNLLLANQIICFSKTQADLWARRYHVSRSRFEALPYGMDVDFYRSNRRSDRLDPPEVLAIGRDVGRDFSTLTRAVSGLKVNLNLITLPYLLPPLSELTTNIRVYERVTYNALMEFYSRASVAVVPLKDELSYPSGIRAVMEAVLLGIPVICTYTPVLEEYFEAESEILYVPPGNVQYMSSAIVRLTGDEKLATEISAAALEKMVKYYSVDSYADQLEECLAKLF